MISLRSVSLAIALLLLLLVQQPLHDALAHEDGVVHCDFCVAAPAGAACAWDAPEIPPAIADAHVWESLPSASARQAVVPACRGPPLYL